MPYEVVKNLLTKCMMITVKKINREVVRAIPNNEIPIDKIKGANLFPRLYPNIFLLAKKRSGKTSTIFKILKSCVGKESKLFIFASTVNVDKNWIFITKWLDKKQIEYETFLSIKDGKINLLADIIKGLEVGDKEDDEHASDDEYEDPLTELQKRMAWTEDEVLHEDKPKKRKPNKVASKYFFIFDDLGTGLRSPVVSDLLKKHRHYLCTCILSSQYLHDLEPEARLQLDYVLIFGGNSDDKLKILHKDLDLSAPFDLFMKLYYDATKKKYNFLYVDTRSEVFRRNFNEEYKLPL